MAAYAALILPFGFATGLFQLDPNADGLVRAALIAVILPALGEELVFRGPLLVVDGRTARRLAFPLLAAFIVWHPLNAWLFTPAARDLFTDWRFLVEAAALGAACAYAALKARSLWPAIAIHWAAVVAWKALLGGPDLF